VRHLVFLQSHLVAIFAAIAGHGGVLAFDATAFDMHMRFAISPVLQSVVYRRLTRCRGGGVASMHQWLEW